MPEKYRISATPSLYTEGEFKGKLRGVTFTATTADDNREWFTRNCGQFEEAFSRILAPALANGIVVSLMRGETVAFPDLYFEQQFARGFMFEWTPVYSVVPPAFAFQS